MAAVLQVDQVDQLVDGPLARAHLHGARHNARQLAVPKNSNGIGFVA